MILNSSKQDNLNYNLLIEEQALESNDFIQVGSSVAAPSTPGTNDFYITSECFGLKW